MNVIKETIECPGISGPDHAQIILRNGMTIEVNDEGIAVHRAGIETEVFASIMFEASKVKEIANDRFRTVRLKSLKDVVGMWAPAEYSDSLLIAHCIGFHTAKIDSFQKDRIEQIANAHGWKVETL